MKLYILGSDRDWNLGLAQWTFWIRRVRFLHAFFACCMSSGTKHGWINHHLAAANHAIGTVDNVFFNFIWACKVEIGIDRGNVAFLFVYRNF